MKKTLNEKGIRSLLKNNIYFQCTYSPVTKKTAVEKF